jgi:hypothetical protein
MTKSNLALLYNLIGFGVFFIFIRYFAINYTSLTGFWKPLTSFIVATLLAPKFRAGNMGKGEKVYMRWLFTKGVKEIG